MSVASEHPRPVRAGNDPTTATLGSEAAVIDVPASAIVSTSAIAPTAAIVPTSAIAPTASTTAPASIEEHRAAVLRRRDEAERLGEDIAELSSRIQAATYQLLVMIRAFDEREGWSGFKSCAHWLNWRTGLALGAAREKVRVARALGDLPLLSGAMRRGQLSYSKVRALTRVATPANERRLLGFAECAPAAYVERLARAWARVDRQAEAADERRRHERRHLNTWVDDDGMVVIRGRLSPEVGALVRRALEAAADRLRTDVSAEEAAETSFGQRQANALGLLAESALSSDLDRGSAGIGTRSCCTSSRSRCGPMPAGGRALRWRRNGPTQRTSPRRRCPMTTRLAATRGSRRLTVEPLPWSRAKQASTVPPASPRRRRGPTLKTSPRRPDRAPALLPCRYVRLPGWAGTPRSRTRTGSACRPRPPAAWRAMPGRS